MSPSDFIPDLQPIAALEEPVRDIVGRSYDRARGGAAERFSHGRVLNVVAIPGSYENASHVAIAIRGTPPRGLVVLSLANPHVAIDMQTQRRLAPNDTTILCQFVEAISGISRIGLLANDFRWTSRDDGFGPCHQIESPRS